MDAFDDCPKVELHLHLEGAIPLPALWTLIQKYGGDPTVPNANALKERFIFRDFPHFIELWIWKNNFIREYEDFTWIAEAVAGDLVSQNVRYAESFFSPTGFAGFGLRPQKIAEAIRKGFNRVDQVSIALIADLVRDSSLELAGRTLAEINECRDLGVIGIGIGGPEQAYPPDRFEPIYTQARQWGLHTTAHAGEGAGPASIWGAINKLKIERIGHGTRAFEDPRLVEYLAAEHIPLEMCPLSNLCTKVVATPKELPIRRYVDQGITVTINTDDPKMFGNCLSDEYRLLHDQLGFTAEEIRTLILNGVFSSWAVPAMKTHLAEEIKAFEF